MYKKRFELPEKELITFIKMDLALIYKGWYAIKPNQTNIQVEGSYWYYLTISWENKEITGDHRLNKELVDWLVLQR